MISGALTAFLTGITEPIEFAFLFVAPMLYAVHSVLAGLAYFLCVALDIKHGFTFSHGLIDYIVLFPKSSGALWLFVIGPIWGGDLLCHLLLRGPPVPSAHAGPRGGRGGARPRAWCPPTSSRSSSFAPSGDGRTSSASMRAS